MNPEAAGFEVVHVVPPEAEQIADAKGCIGAEDDEGVVAEFAVVVVVGGEAAEVFLAADGFGCNRHENKPLSDFKSLQSTPK